jgi:hypothetical protein
MLVGLTNQFSAEKATLSSIWCDDFKKCFIKKKKINFHNMGGSRAKGILFPHQHEAPAVSGKHKMTPYKL